MVQENNRICLTNYADRKMYNYEGTSYQKTTGQATAKKKRLTYHIMEIFQGKLGKAQGYQFILAVFGYFVEPETKHDTISGNLAYEASEARPNPSFFSSEKVYN